MEQVCLTGDIGGYIFIFSLDARLKLVARDFRLDRGLEHSDYLLLVRGEVKGLVPDCGPLSISLDHLRGRLLHT